MDDKIICSWCFNFIECFDSISFGTIIVLIKTLESLLSLRSQQKMPQDSCRHIGVYILQQQELKYLQVHRSKVFDIEVLKVRLMCIEHNEISVMLESFFIKIKQESLFFSKYLGLELYS